MFKVNLNRMNINKYNLKLSSTWCSGGQSPPVETFLFSLSRNVLLLYFKYLLRIVNITISPPPPKIDIFKIQEGSMPPPPPHDLPVSMKSFIYKLCYVFLLYNCKIILIEENPLEPHSELGQAGFCDVCSIACDFRKPLPA